MRTAQSKYNYHYRMGAFIHLIRRIIYFQHFNVYNYSICISITQMEIEKVFFHHRKSINLLDWRDYGSKNIFAMREFQISDQWCRFGKLKYFLGYLCGESAVLLSTSRFDCVLAFSTTKTYSDSVEIISCRSISEAYSTIAECFQYFFHWYFGCWNGTWMQ